MAGLPIETVAPQSFIMERDVILPQANVTEADCRRRSPQLGRPCG